MKQVSLLLFSVSLLFVFSDKETKMNSPCILQMINKQKDQNSSLNLPDFWAQALNHQVLRCPSMSTLIVWVAYLALSMHDLCHYCHFVRLYSFLQWDSKQREERPTVLPSHIERNPSEANVSWQMIWVLPPWPKWILNRAHQCLNTKEWVKEKIQSILG